MAKDIKLYKDAIQKLLLMNLNLEHFLRIRL